MQGIGWGIYGPGGIAGRFVKAMAGVSGAEVRGVAGRTPQKSADFARLHGIAATEPSLAALVAREDIDVVYVATTHNVHCHAACTCLAAGKAVLCEKPLAMNAAEVRQMISLSRRESVFLMEALWTRFLPAWQRVRELLSDHAIGEPRLISGTFGFSGSPDPKGRLLNKALAGGALLDLGVYPISMAQMVSPGPVEGVSAQARIGPTGVDTITGMAIRFSGDCVALLSAAIGACTENTMILSGERGAIKVGAPFWAATSIEWTADGQDWQTEHYPHGDDGFVYELEAVNRCLRAGEIESTIMPHADSLQVAQIMDAVRSQVGLRFDADDHPCEPCV